MAEVDETAVMTALQDTLSKVDDADTRRRVLTWAWSKFCAGSPPPGEPTREEKRRGKAKKTGKTVRRYSIVRDLDLRPRGKQSFKEFVEQKPPASNHERCVVSVYYLSRVLELDTVKANHVFTCFRDIHWRQPADLYNELVWVGSQKGWLDTSDMNNIRLTSSGENWVEHDLPAKESNP